MRQAINQCFVVALHTTWVSCKGLKEGMVMLCQYSSPKPVLWCLVNIMVTFHRIIEPFNDLMILLCVSNRCRNFLSLYGLSAEDWSIFFSNHI